MMRVPIPERSPGRLHTVLTPPLTGLGIPHLVASASPPLTRGKSSSERREQVNHAAVGIPHLRVALAPERIPRFSMSLSAGRSEFSVQPVDLVRRLTAEGYGHAMAARG